MRTNFLRLAFLAVLGSVAVPASAQRTGPCPPAGFGPRTGPATAVTITESRPILLIERPATEPIDCLFAPDGQVRAALYPSSLYELGPLVRVFRTGVEYGSPWVEQSAQTITVSRVSRFSDLDRTTLERIATVAGVPRQEPVAGAANGSAPQPAPEPAPNTATLRRASYNPTTPPTQSSATNLRGTSFTYDLLDRLKSETVKLEDGSTATISYTYWKNGKRKTVTDAMGRVTFYEYDGVNRLKRLTANQGLPDEQVTSYTYWPDDLLKTVTKPDGTVTSYDYDDADRLESVVVRKDGIDLVSYAYTYDANGNRTSQVEVNGGSPETTTYTYDNIDRLKTVTYPDGLSVAYGYDNVGNRTSETERDPAGVVVSEKVALFDAANRLSTVTDAVNPANNATFSYDRNGNVETKTTSAGTATYVYDLRDQLVETREGEHISARFAYDAFGRRYLKIGNEGIRQYLYDQTSLLEEFTETNVEVAKYEWGGDRLVSLFRFNEPRRYFHFDALGSVAALTDDTGSVAARYHYDAWGRYRDPTELEASANRFGFTGHYFDTETKLYFAKARYYDADYGRFLTADSYLGELDNPPSLHRYFYGHANPLRYVDPTGHQSVPPDDVYFASADERTREAQQAAGSFLGGAKGLLDGLVSTVKGAGHLVLGAFGHEPSIEAGKEFLDDAQTFLAHPIRSKTEQYQRAHAVAQAKYQAGDYFGSGEVIGQTAGPDALVAGGAVGGISGAVRRAVSSVRRGAAPSMVFEGASQVLPEATVGAEGILPAGRPLPQAGVAGGSQGATTEAAGLSVASKALGREQIISRVNQTVEPHLEAIRSLDPDAVVGLRGSLARGLKGPQKGNAPFDPANFDVDAFIVSDRLAAPYPRTLPFRDATRYSELESAQKAIEVQLRKTPGFEGLRSEPFRFRIFTEKEIKALQRRGDVQTLIGGGN